MQEWVAGESRDGALGHYEVLWLLGNNGRRRYGLVSFRSEGERAFLSFVAGTEDVKLEHIERNHVNACVEAVARILAEERADDFTAYVRSLPEDLRFFILDEDDEDEAARLRETVRDALFVGVRFGKGDPYRMSVYFEKDFYGAYPDERIVEMMRTLPRDVVAEARSRGLVDGCSRKIEESIGERSQTVRNAATSCREWLDGTKVANDDAPRP